MYSTRFVVCNQNSCYFDGLGYYGNTVVIILSFDGTVRTYITRVWSKQDRYTKRTKQ